MAGRKPSLREEEEFQDAVRLSLEIAERRFAEEQRNPNPAADRLISSCSLGLVAEVKLSLRHGQSPNVVRVVGTPLGASVASPRPIEIASLLIEAKADLNLLDRNGWSPLFIAAGNDLAQVVQFLLQRGANPNQRCPSVISRKFTNVYVERELGLSRKRYRSRNSS